MNIVSKEEVQRKIKEGYILPLTSDIVFKSVFARNEKVLIKMLRDVFEIGEIDKPFTIVGFETAPSKVEGKSYRADILIKLSDYSYVLIEMNNRKDPNVIDRNMVNLVRIHSQVLEQGEEDKDLKYYRLRGLNFNNFKNETGGPIEHYAICNMTTGKVMSLIYSFCNIDLEMCKNLVYDINVRNLPNSVRWGAIMMQESIDKISYILGEDMLSMEEKERFLETIKEVNDDKSLLNDWVIEENARQKFISQVNYAKEEGIEEGIERGIEQGSEMNKLEIIKNMLEEKTNYEFISKVTGKSIEEIKKIESNMKNEE